MRGLGYGLISGAGIGTLFGVDFIVSVGLIIGPILVMAAENKYRNKIFNEVRELLTDLKKTTIP